MSTDHTLPERAREVLSYCKESGMFTWRKRRGSVRSGAIAGSRHGAYWSIRVFGKTIMAHRLAVLMVEGAFPVPPLVVDHIDGNPLNNSWSNLRVVSYTLNNQNLRRAINGSKSGLLGAHWNSQDHKWQAGIRINGKNVHLGKFNTPELAHAAYMAAKRIHHPGNTL